MKQPPNSNWNVNNIPYKLHSVVFHHGASIIGGHYTAMVREENKWLHLNDEHTDQVTWNGPAIVRMHTYYFTLNNCEMMHTYYVFYLQLVSL